MEESQAKVEWKTLKDVCISATSGGTPLSSNRKYYEGDIPWLRTQEVDWKDVYDTEFKITEEAVAHSSARLVPKNCVIVAMYGATAAKVCVNKIPLTTNQACCNLQIDEKVAHYKYVFYWLAKEYENLKSLAVGGQANLSAEIIKGYKIPVPSVIEQERIASALSSVDELIASLDKQIAKTRDIKQGVMQQLLTGATRIKGFSGQWQSRKLGEIGSTYSGLTGKSKQDFIKGNCLYITFLNVLNNPILKPESFETVYVGEGERQNNARKGDLFFNTSSETPEEVGICAVLNEDVTHLYLNSFCFGYRLNDRNVDPLFLSYYFRSKRGRDVMSAVAQGITRYNLSKSAFSKIYIALPPLAEQEHIADVLTSFDNAIEDLETKRQKYEYVKAGMMQQLLSGATCCVNS